MALNIIAASMGWIPTESARETKIPPNMIMSEKGSINMPKTVKIKGTMMTTNHNGRCIVARDALMLSVTPRSSNSSVMEKPAKAMTMIGAIPVMLS